MDYASVTSIIHCRLCCNFLISRCHQQTPAYRLCGWRGHCSV